MTNTEPVSFDDTGSDRPSNEITSNMKNARTTFNRKKLHPLFPQLRLLTVLLSGKPLEQQNSQMRLKKSYVIQGERRQKHDMKEFSKNGENIVYNNMKIPILQIQNQY